MLSLQSRLDLYLALSLITVIVMVAAEPWRGMGTEEDGGGWKGDEWNPRKPIYLPRERLLSKPDPAPADDFLFWGSKKVNLLIVWWRGRPFCVGLDTKCSFSPRGVRQRCQSQSPQRRSTPASLHIFESFLHGTIAIAITGGMGHKGRAAARPRTLRGAWIWFLTVF